MLKRKLITTCLSMFCIYLSAATAGAQSFTSVAPGNNQISLAWSKATNARGYNLFRSITGGNDYQQLTYVKGSTAYTDTAVINAQPYYYRVQAVFTRSRGNLSAPTSTTPVTPTTDAQLPRFTVNSDYVEPVGAPEVRLDSQNLSQTDMVGNGQELQNKLDIVQPGEKLIVPSGYVYYPPTGGFIIPKKGGFGNIYVTTDQYASLPAPGRRVTANDIAKMPTLRGIRHNEPVLKFAKGASNWRFVGINVDIDEEIAIRGNAQFHVVQNIIDMGSEALNLDEFPSGNVFDRCTLHSHNNCEVKRILYMGGRYNAVVDSRVYEGTSAWVQAQAIALLNGSGPHKIVNNYLNGSGEIVFLGGSDPKLKGIVAMDVEIRRNYFFKFPEWVSKTDGGPWGIMNHLESKASARVLVEGNVFQNSRVGDDGHSGQAVLLKSTHEGTDPSQLTSDWILRYNKFDNCSAGYALVGVQATNPDGTSNPAGYTNQGTKRIHIHDNLFTKFAELPGRKWLLDLNSLPDNQPYSHKQLRDIRVEHETAVHVNETGTGTDSSTMALGDKENGQFQRTRNFVFRDNIVGAGKYGIIGGDVHGTEALREYTPGYEPNVVNNVIIRMPTHNHPLSVTIASASPRVPPSTAAVGFENYTAEDFRLRTDSPYKGRATTVGRDPGADIAGVNQRTAGAISGVWQ